MKRLLSLAVIAGAGYWAWRHFQGRARPAAQVPELPSDDLLTRRVLVAIKRAGPLPQGLHVRVMDGTVVLAGAVTAQARGDILRAVLAVPGIRGVRNGLQLEGAKPSLDPDLAVESQPWEPSARPR